MKKRLRMRKWLALLLCVVFVFGSVNDVTSFATQANKYSAFDEESSFTEQTFDRDADMLGVAEGKSMTEGAKVDDIQINADSKTQEPNRIATDSNAGREDRTDEKDDSYAPSAHNRIVPLKQRKIVDEIDSTSERLQIQSLTNATNIQDGFISDGFTGTVSFQGQDLTKTISDAYLEIKLQPAMLLGMPEDFGSVLFNDLNTKTVEIPGFRLQNGNGDYIKDVTYFLDESEDQNIYLFARARLQPLTKDTDGSIEYHIQFKNDGSVPKGYILPVDASFYYASGEVLLHMDTAYFRANYPATPSDTQSSTDVREVADGVQDISDTPIEASEETPMVEEVISVPESPVLTQIQRPKKQIETDDIKIEVKWEKDWSVRYLRPKSLQVHLYRTLNHGDLTLVSDLELSNRAAFDETWVAIFEDVEKADEFGNAYEFVVQLDIDDDSGMRNYQISNPIRSLDGSKFTWIAKYQPMFLRAKIRWEDNQNEHQVRPNTVYVQLKRKIGESEFQNIGNAVRIESNSWSHEFGEYPRFDEQGREISYLIEELDDDRLKNYPVSIETDDGNVPNRIFSMDEGTMTITNSVQEMVIPIRIHWNESDFGSRYRPNQIHLKLIRDTGNSLQSVSKIFYGEKNEAHWNGEFDNLVKYDGNGKEIRYYLIDNNSLFDRNYELFNTYKSENTIYIENYLTLIEERVKVSWDREQSHALPQNMELELYRGIIGEIPKRVENVVLSTMMSEYTFQNLPKFDENGHLYLYFVRQKNEHSNFVTEYEKIEQTTFIHNRFQGLDMDVTLEWKGDNERERPSFVSVRLLRRTQEEPFAVLSGVEATLRTERQKHSNVFTDLPKYDGDGREYEYRIEEIRTDALKEYSLHSSKSDAQTFVLHHTKSQTGIPLRVDWVDFANTFQSRPDKLRIQLYEQNENSDLVAFGSPMELSEKSTFDGGNSWQIYLSDIKRFDNDKSERRFIAKVSDENLNKGYSFAMRVQNESVANGEIVLIGQLQTKSIPISWSFDDASHSAGRPNQISFRLLRFQDGVKDAQFTQSITVNTREQSASFAQVPEYDDFGNRYDYLVEIANPNVFANYEVVTKKKNDAFEFAFQYHPIDILFRMDWDDMDNSLHLRPKKLRFKLARKLKNTQNPYSEVEDMEVVFDGNPDIWTYTFKDVPRFDSNGNVYEYGILDVDDIDVLKNYQTTVSYDGAAPMIRMVSKLELKTIEVESDWIGDLKSPSDRPRFLEMELYRSVDDKTELLQTKMLRGIDNVWSYSFRDLPKFDQNGNTYEYDVKIKDVQNYILTKVDSKVKPDKFIFTLQLYVKNIRAKFVWNDSENEYGLRPSTVSVLLKRSIDQKNYEVIHEPITIQAPNWIANFGAFPAKDIYGNVYDYRLEVINQAALHNYTEQIIQNEMFRSVDKTFLISYDMDLRSIPVVIHWAEGMAPPAQIKIVLTRYGSTPIPKFTKLVNFDSNTSSYRTEFKDMPKFDKNGEPFDYRVSIECVETDNIDSYSLESSESGFYKVIIQ